MITRRVGIEDLAIMWPAVAEQMGEQKDFSGEALETALFSGTWDLWVTSDEGDMVASAITAYVGGWLWIFHATSTRQESGWMNHFADLMEEVFSPMQDYKGIRFNTERKGFERVAPSLGFEQEGIRIYSRRMA